MPSLEGIKLIAVGLLLMLLLGMVAVVKVERSKVGQLTAQLSQAADANKQDQVVIDGMKAALKEWQDAVARSAIAEAAAKAALETQAGTRVATAQKLKGMENSDNAIPGCADVLRVDLAMFCPGNVAAERLRSDASDHLQGSPRPSTGTGSRPTRLSANR